MCGGEQPPARHVRWPDDGGCRHACAQGCALCGQQVPVVCAWYAPLRNCGGRIRRGGGCSGESGGPQSHAQLAEERRLRAGVPQRVRCLVFSAGRARDRRPVEQDDSSHCSQGECEDRTHAHLRQHGAALPVGDAPAQTRPRAAAAARNQTRRPHPAPPAHRASHPAGGSHSAAG